MRQRAGIADRILSKITHRRNPCAPACPRAAAACAYARALAPARGTRIVRCGIGAAKKDCRREASHFFMGCHTCAICFVDIMAAIRVVHRDRHASRIDADPVIASRVIFMAVFRRVDATECALAARIRSRGERRRGRGRGAGGGGEGAREPCAAASR
ncbi:hypothetical protein SZ29_01835 [Burkholderia pseudomallei]|nr:hypothetical protein SZ29_01835 [Burkholderia pseudomallei]